MGSFQFFKIQQIIFYEFLDFFFFCQGREDNQHNSIRFKKIIVRYQDLLGKERKLSAEDDLFCRCIQHEVDHLDGKLFVDKTADEAQMKKILKEAGFENVVSPASPIMIG